MRFPSWLRRSPRPLSPEKAIVKPLPQKRKTATAVGRSHKPRLEGLEDRTLPAVFLPGIPDFTPAGPAPIIDAQSETSNDGSIGHNQVVGAVEAIAIDPINTNRAYVGTPNGGIWRTDNLYDPDHPSWAPLTDKARSESISSLAILPTNSLVVYAGIGRTSSGNHDGGSLTGILRSSNGGDSWLQLGTQPVSTTVNPDGTTMKPGGLGGADVRSIVPTALNTDGTLNTQIVLAGTDQGVFLSQDGGQTWTDESVRPGSGLVSGPVSELVVDPGFGPDNHTVVLYAAVPGKGIFRAFLTHPATPSDPAPALLPLSWALVGGPGGALDGLPTPYGITTSVAATNRIRLAVGDALDSVVYAMLIEPVGSGAQMVGIFGSVDFGQTWTFFGLAPEPIDGGGQGTTHDAMVVDPTTNDILYVSGDRHTNGDPPAGMAYKGTFDFATGQVLDWTSLVDYSDAPSPVSGKPHSDSRTLVFGGTDLFEGNDGGIYRLNNAIDPNAGDSSWASLNGNLGPTEFYAVDWTDAGQIIGAAQDNGVDYQAQPTAVVWNQLQEGDGWGVQTSFGAAPPFDVTYSLTNAGLHARFYPLDIDTDQNLNVTDQNNQPLHAVDPGAGLGADGYRPLPFAVNPVDQARLLIGTSHLYESTDGGDDLQDLGPIGPANGTGSYGFTPITALAYGGYVNGQPAPLVLYVAAAGVGGGPGVLDFRTAGGLLIPVTYPGTATIRKIIMDPSNAQTVYVIEADGTVWMSTTIGATWQNLTGNLGNFTKDPRSINLAQTSPNVLLVGAGRGVINTSPGVNQSGDGGIYRLINPGVGTPVWSLYGRNFPNVLTTDIHSATGVNQTDLLVGTFGRGAFVLTDAQNTLTTRGSILVKGDDDPNLPNDVLRLSLEPNNPLLLDVFLNSTTPTQLVPVAAVSTIVFIGGAGADTMIVDFSNGVFNPPSGIDFVGGPDANTPGDTLEVIDNNPAVSPAVYRPFGGGDGSVNADGVDINFLDLTPVIINNAATLTVITPFVITPNPGKNLSLDSPGAGQLRVSGSSGGVSFENVTVGSTTTQVTLDLATNDQATAQDSVSTTAATFLAVPATNFVLKTGPNVPGNTFTLDAQGQDVIITSNTIQVVGAGMLTYDTLGTIILNNASNVMVEGSPGAALQINGDTTVSSTGTAVAFLKVVGTSGNVNLVVGGNDYITFGPLQNILGPVTITYNPGGAAVLYLDDSADSTAQTGTLTTVMPLEASVPYGLITGLAPAAIEFQWQETQEVHILTGKGDDTFNVLATGSPVFLDSAGGADVVNIGRSGRQSGPDGVQDILARVQVANSKGLTELTVDDSADTTAQTAILYTLVTLGDSGRAISFGVIADLAPAPIEFQWQGIQEVQTFLGQQNDSFDVQSTRKPVFLYGGPGNDMIEVGDSANTLDGIQGALTISGQGGADGLEINDHGSELAHDYTLSSGATFSTLTRSGAAPITYDDTTETVAVLGSSGHDTWTVLSPAPAFPVIFVGQGTQNTLVGPDSPSTVWQILGADSGLLGLVTFQHMQNLVGGGSSNTFHFNNQGSISGTINGGSPLANTLDYGGTKTAVMVNLAQHSASRIQGGTADGFSQITGLVGGSASDTLTGDNTVNLWQITGPDRGNVNGFQFSNVENLRGGSGVDTFRFTAAASKLSGLIDGGGGGDWLDYSATNQAVTVNLQTGAASRVALGVSNIQHVIGSLGDNTLTGDSNGNILIGGGGSNTLTAGSGRSLLIGGTGLSVLRAGAADCILIAGVTIYDANEVALAAIFKEWQRTDLTGTAQQQYLTRINDLRLGIGYSNGYQLIWGATVLDADKPGAQLFHGAGGLDWYFLSLNNDDIFGLLVGKEKLNNLV
jgi:hypothetical protein